MYAIGDISVEELINGVNKARSTIKSGEVYTKTTKVSEADKTEEEIAEWIKTEKDKELKRINSGVSKSEAEIELFETIYLKADLEDRANRFHRKNTINRLTTTLFKVINTGDSFKKSQYEYKLTRIDSPEVPLDENSNRFQPSDYIALLVYDMQTQVKQFIGNITGSVDNASAITFYDHTQHEGFEYFQFSGRSIYNVPSDAKHVGTEKIDGVECHILEFITPNRRRMKIWIDPEKDYAVHRFDIIHPTMEMVFWRSIYKKFVKYGDIWFPQVAVDNSFFRDGRIRTTSTDEVIDAEFNVEFPDGFFDIEKGYYKPPDSE